MDSAVLDRPARTHRAYPARSTRWLVLIAMTCSLSMIMLDQTVVTVALPTMTRDLPLTASGQQWVVNAYVLAIAAVVAFGGRAADRLGPVTCFRLGVVVFFAASVGCALAPSGGLGEPWLLAARAVQGVGSALLIPVSGSLVMNAFPRAVAGRAMGVYAGVSLVFLAFGPLIGGLLTQYVSWRAVFWVNVPVGLAALAMVGVARPDNRRDRTARVSLPQLALLVVGLGSTVLAVQESSRWGWGSVRTLAVLGVGLALTALFTLAQLRDAEPIVAVRMLADRGLSATIGVAFAVQFGLLAVVLFTSLYAQDLLHFGPVLVGVAALPFVLPIMVGAQLGGRRYDRSGVRGPVLAGLALCVVGLLLLTVAAPQLAYRDQVPGLLLLGLGLGLTVSPGNTDALARVGAAQRAHASGILQTFRQLGGTIGIAVLGAIVLGYQHSAPAAGVGPARHAADAVALGFGAATAVFAVTLVAGWFLLPRGRATAPAASLPAAWE